VTWRLGSCSIHDWFLQNSKVQQQDHKTPHHRTPFRFTHRRSLVITSAVLIFMSDEFSSRREVECTRMFLAHPSSLFRQGLTKQLTAQALTRCIALPILSTVQTVRISCFILTDACYSGPTDHSEVGHLAVFYNADLTMAAFYSTNRN
jgi:hypothetical protein